MSERVWKLDSDKEPIFLQYEKDPVLCGFVWCFGYRDFEAWEVNLEEDDRNAIEKILEKYNTYGTSVRNCWGEKFSDVFCSEY